MVVLAMLLAVAVHWLFRSSRKTLEVATLRLFADRARPRLSVSRLHEPALLAARLLLLGGVIVALLQLLPLGVNRVSVSEFTLVLPGTDSTTVALLETRYANLRWLDRELSELSQEPDSTDWVANLLALDQRLPMSVTLRVAGELDAQAWPVRAPVTRREIVWEVTPAQRALSGWPQYLVLVTDAAEREARLRAVVGIWQSFGLLDQTTIAWPDAADSTSKPLIWWSSAALPGQPFGLAIGGAKPVGPGWRHVEDPQSLSDAELAAALWAELIHFESYRPRPDAVIEPVTQVKSTRDGTPLNARPVDSPTTAWAWLAVLFVVERLMAVWAMRR